MDAENKSEESVMDFLTPLLARFDKIYYDLAKRHGESYFGMWVLEEIGDKPEGVTQKQVVRDFVLAQANGEFPRCVLCAAWLGGNKAQ